MAPFSMWKSEQNKKENPKSRCVLAIPKWTWNEQTLPEEPTQQWHSTRRVRNQLQHKGRQGQDPANHGDVGRGWEYADRGKQGRLFRNWT